LLILGLQAGCDKEQIRVYRVPKEERPAVARARPQTPSVPNVKWQTPPTWKEQPAGDMRVARFSVPGKEGQEADVSIIPLPGISARKEDIVNLWREQIHLSPVKEEDLSTSSRRLKLAQDRRSCSTW